MTSEMTPTTWSIMAAEVADNPDAFSRDAMCGLIVKLSAENARLAALTRPNPALSAADADEIVRLAEAWVDAGIRHRVAIYAHDLSGDYQALERKLNAAQYAFEAKIKELRG